MDFSLKNTLRLTGFTLRVNRKQLIGWTVAVFGISFLYMYLFPMVKDMAQMKMDAMPKELLQFVKMDNFSDMGNFITYFGTIFNMLLIAICVFAATFAGGIVQKEERSGAIEYLYSLKTSRTEIYVSKCISAIIAVMVVLVATVIASAICGYINGGETFIASSLFKIGAMSIGTVVLYTSATMMLAGAISSISAPMAGSMVVLTSYVAGFISTLLGSDYAWMAWLSPFDKLSAVNVLTDGTQAFTALCVYLAVALVMLICGGVAYQHRDFKL